MCSICFSKSQPWDPSPTASEKEKARERAVLLKKEIEYREYLLRYARERGEAPCMETIMDLDQLREEQYEISRKI